MKVLTQFPVFLQSTVTISNLKYRNFQPNFCHFSDVNSKQRFCDLLVVSSRKVTLRICRTHVSAAVFLEIKTKFYSLPLIPSFFHSTALQRSQSARGTTALHRSNVLFQQDATHQFAIQSPAPPSGAQLRYSSLAHRAAITLTLLCGHAFCT